MWETFFIKKVAETNSHLSSDIKKFPSNATSAFSFSPDGKILSGKPAFIIGLNIQSSALFKAAGKVGLNQSGLIFHPDFKDGVRRLHFFRNDESSYSTCSFDTEKFIPFPNIKNLVITVTRKEVIQYATNSNWVGNKIRSTALLVNEGKLYLSRNRRLPLMEETELIIYQDISVLVVIVSLLTLLILISFFIVYRRSRSIRLQINESTEEVEKLKTISQVIINIPEIENQPMQEKLSELELLFTTISRSYVSSEWYFSENVLFAEIFKNLTSKISKMIGSVSGYSKALQNKVDELDQFQSLLQNVINSMPSVLIGVDKDLKVSLWNEQAESLLGISISDALGKDVHQIHTIVDEFSDDLFASMQEKTIIEREFEYRGNDKKSIYAITLFPLSSIVDSSNGVVNGIEGAVIRIDDVTGKVQMEEMIIQSEKMLSVGGLAAGMAHEINNPLAGMMQSAYVMADRLGKKDMPANLKAAEAAGTTMEAIRNFMDTRGIPRMITSINDSGRRVSEIVGNMLSFARKSDSSTSSYDLADLLDKTLELASVDYDLKKRHDFKMIEIIKEYENNLPFLPCEGAKIQQVLLNILGNGAQAMQEAKTGKPSFIIRTHFMKERKMVCIEIEDNGPGMDEEIRRRIFEPFFTTKPVGVGTGLGLSVSYFIITENHDGEMTVESQPGSGAKFIIRLPLERKNE